jgi:hypothetical protein
MIEAGDWAVRILEKTRGFMIFGDDKIVVEFDGNPDVSWYLRRNPTRRENPGLQRHESE